MADNNNNRQEWKNRYQFAFDIAKQEYLLQIDRIKNLDEKIEKFLVVAAAFIAAMITIIGNNDFIKNVMKFKACNLIDNQIKLVIIILIVISFYFSFKSFENFLNGLSLRNTCRMPNTIDLLHRPRESSLEWTYDVIKFYEEAIKALEEVINEKIPFVQAGYSALKKHIFCSFAVILLISIQNSLI